MPCGGQKGLVRETDLLPAGCGNNLRERRFVSLWRGSQLWCRAMMAMIEGKNNGQCVGGLIGQWSRWSGQPGWTDGRTSDLVCAQKSCVITRLQDDNYFFSEVCHGKKF